MIINTPKIQKIESEMIKEIVSILQEENIRVYMACGSVLGAVRHNGPIPWDHDVDMFFWLDDLDAVLAALRRKLSSRFTVDFFDVNPNYQVMFPRVGLANSKSEDVHVDLFPLFFTSDDDKKRAKQYKKIVLLHYIYTHYKFRRYSVRKKPFYQFMAKAVELCFSPISKKYLQNACYRLANKYNTEKSKYVGFVGMSRSETLFEMELLDPGRMHPYEDFYVPIPNRYDEYLTHCYGDYMTYPSVAEQKLGREFSTRISDADGNTFFGKQG